MTLRRPDDPAGKRQRPPDVGFSAAFGPERGPSRDTISRELAATQERLARRDERIAGLEAELEHQRMRTAVAEDSIDHLNIVAEKARREERLSVYRLRMLAYACLYAVPGKRLPLWAVPWTDLNSSDFQGEFSARRPYIAYDSVRDGPHGVFAAMVALAPSRVRPHKDPDRWVEISEYKHHIEPRSGTPAEDWRFGPAHDRHFDHFSVEDLRAWIAEARANAEREWYGELGEAASLYPCPAFAYPTDRQWLEDMPGFRTAVTELRLRKRLATGGR